MTQYKMIDWKKETDNEVFISREQIIEMYKEIHQSQFNVIGFNIHIEVQ